MYLPRAFGNQNPGSLPELTKIGVYHLSPSANDSGGRVGCSWRRGAEHHDLVHPESGCRGGTVDEEEHVIHRVARSEAVGCAVVAPGVTGEALAGGV
jgi:hypothetical protein